MMEKSCFILLLCLYFNRDVSAATMSPSRSPTITPSKTPTVSPSTRVPTFIPTVIPSTFNSVYNYIYNVAGAATGATSSSGTGGKATAAKFVGPVGLHQDTTGMLYVVDYSDHCIRVFNPTTDSIVYKYAGVCGTSGDTYDKAASSAYLNYPAGVYSDTTGKAYVADKENHRVKLVSSGGYMTLFAGTGSTGQTGTGQATAATIGNPNDVFINSVGLIYVVSIDGTMVRTISTSGIISFFAGTYATSTSGGDNGAATSAKFAGPARVSGDTTGKIYIVDSADNRIRYVSTDNIIHAFIGTGSYGYLGENIPPTSANLNNPKGFSIDSRNGDVYVSNSNGNRIFYLASATNRVNTYAGTGTSGNTGNGGAATAATMADPRMNWLDTLGKLYFVDYSNANVRVIYSIEPTTAPTVQPTVIPSLGPTTFQPSQAPSVLPSLGPTANPTAVRSSLNSVFLLVGTGSASSGGTGGKATAAAINGPRSVWKDTVGTIYWSEGNGHCLRKISDSSNIVTAFAGICSSSGYTGNGGQATAATVNGPVGVFGNSAGVVYFADYTNNRVRIVSNGIMSLYAGTGTSSTTGNGGQATAANIMNPFHVFLDSVSTLYITCLSAYLVRSVSSTGIIRAFAGIENNAVSGDGGPATSAALATERVFGTSSGNIYVSDPVHHVVRRVSSAGIISTYAGNGNAAYVAENIAPTAIGLNLPSGIFVESSNGDIYINDREGGRMYVVTGTTGLVSTFAGTGTAGNSGNSGAATSANVYGEDVIKDSNSNVYFNDYTNNVLRVIATMMPTTTPTVVPSLSQNPTVNPTLVRSTLNNIYNVVGTGSTSSTGNYGLATAATMNAPRTVYHDTVGFLYFTESGGHCVRKFSTADKIVVPVAGQCGTLGSGGEGGQATAAYLYFPVSIMLNSASKIYLTDMSNQKIKTIPTSGIVSVFAGTGTLGMTGDGGPATSATFASPHGLWLNSNGVVYMATYLNPQVRVISTGGIITLVAGTGTVGFSGDGGMATSALINNNERILGDSNGIIYLADSSSNRVRTISTSSIIKTVIGSASTTFVEGVPATAAGLNYPTGIELDSANGDFYLSSRGNNKVHVVTGSTGLISNYIGTGTASSGGDGAPATSATLNSPDGLYIDTSNKYLYVAEWIGNKIRVVYSVAPSAAPSVVPTTPTVAPVGPTRSPTTASPSVSQGPTPTPTKTRGTMMNIYLLAGTGTASSTGTGGLATAATLYAPRSVIQDTVGIIYFTEGSGNCARKISTSNIVSAYAGVCGAAATFSGDNGQATAAKFSASVGLFVTTSAVAYIAEYGNCRVRYVSTSNIITTYAGTGSSTNSGDGGAATAGGINQCHGLWVNSVGVLYVTSLNSNQIRAVSASGILSLFVGVGTAGYIGENGAATSAYINGAEKLWGDSTGVVYVSDSKNNRVRYVSTAGIINVIMGSGSSTWTSDNLPATSATVYFPDGLIIDSTNGDLYVSARSSYRVLVKTATTSIVSTFVGTGTSGSSGDGGAATSATLNGNDGLFLNTNSALYVVDIDNNKIRVVYSQSPTTSPSLVPSYAPSGPTIAPSTALPTYSFAPSFFPTSVRSSTNSIFAVAGTGTASSTGNYGLATAATVNVPRSVSANTVGYMYVTEASSHCIRKFSITYKIVYPVAGQCSTTSGFSGDGGQSTAAYLNYPVGMMIDSTSVLYFADINNNRVRRITTSNIITTYAGTGTAGIAGDGGPATSATFNVPHDVWLNSVGVVYVTTYNNPQVRAISASGIISLIAGTGTAGFSGDGGPATSALLNSNRIVGDSTGTIYQSDQINFRIRQISSGIIKTFAGTGSTPFLAGVAATSAGINYPTHLALDSSNGDLYMCIRANSRVAVITGTTGIISNYAGTGTSSATVDGGAATASTLMSPDGLYLDTNSFLYIVDSDANKIKVVYSVAPSVAPTTIPTAPSVAPVGPTVSPTTSSPTVSFGPTPSPTSVRSTLNIIKTVGGTGSQASSASGSRATATSMNAPRSITQDTTGVIYFAEWSGNCIRSFGSDSIVSNYAGICTTTGSYSGDSGKATSAYLNGPCGISIYNAGSTPSVFVTDLNNNRVRLISNNIITTVVGTGTAGTSGDGGQASSALVYQPAGLWVNSVGSVYFSTYGYGQIKMFTSGGTITLIAGSVIGTLGYLEDGGQATAALLNNPERVHGDSTGLLYVSDSSNNRVRVISTTKIITTFAGWGVAAASVDGVAATACGVYYPTGIAIDSSNGDFYVSARSSNQIKVITKTSGLAYTYAGTGTASSTGDDGAPTAATMNNNDGLLLNSVGMLYAGEFTGSRIRLMYSIAPSSAPSIAPSALPTVIPSLAPSYRPSILPTALPTARPSLSPTASPTLKELPIRSSPSYKVKNALSFAGLGSDGSVVTWGATCCGGDSSSVVYLLLIDVQEVVQSKNAFAALKTDGSVVAWGSAKDIEGSEQFQGYSTIVSLVATEQAFAGVTESGGVIAFGADCCGGNVNQYGWYADHLSSGVKSITASSGAFCALKDDATVFCWGSKFAGGGVSSLSRSDLSGIVLVSATRSAFAGMTSSGSVVTWGSKSFGGVVSASISTKLSQNTQHIISNGVAFVGYTNAKGLIAWGSSKDGGSSTGVVGQFKYVAHTASAFVGIRTNGTIVAWGNDADGGDASSVSASFTNITSVFGNLGAFVAVNSSGHIFAWGDSSFGGNLAANVSFSIGSAVSAVYHTSRAFAVITSSEGGVVAWGHDNFGGEISSGVAESVSSGVRLICANENAFTAIKNDGTAYGWGFGRTAIGDGQLSGDYSLVVSC